MDNLSPTNNPDQEKPLLLLDVDGVICPFGIFIPKGFEHDSFLDVFWSREMGKRINRLRKHFDIVWATLWEESANHFISPLLGLPEFPYIVFDPKKLWPAHSTFKLGAVQDFVKDRPFIWADDDLADDAFLWARERSIDTLLIRTLPNIGLGEEEFAQIESFVG